MGRFFCFSDFYHYFCIIYTLSSSPLYLIDSFAFTSHLKGAFRRYHWQRRSRKKSKKHGGY